MENKYYLYPKGKPVEVSYEIYKEYYRCTEHEKYLIKKSRKNEYSFEQMQDDGISFEFNEGYYEKSAEEEVLHKLQNDEIKTIVSQLDEQQRILVDMYFYQNKSIKEISAFLNMPYSTVYKRFQKTLKTIKKIFLDKKC